MVYSIRDVLGKPLTVEAIKPSKDEGTKLN